MYKTVVGAFILICVHSCFMYTVLAQEECQGEQQLKQKVQELEAENKRLQSELSTSKEKDTLVKKLSDQIDVLKSKHSDELRHLKDNLQQAQNSVRQYTEKVAQQEKQLSSLTINSEVQKQERIKIEQYSSEKISQLQNELYQAQTSTQNCPIIPHFITHQYNKSVQPYVDRVLMHEYSQKVMHAYNEHVDPVVKPVWVKVVNEYVPVAVNYSQWAGQKSYEFGVVVINSPEAKKAKEFALKTDVELQAYVKNTMEGVEQVKQYASVEIARLIVFGIYSVILMMMLMIFSMVCCRSKQSQPKIKEVSKSKQSSQGRASTHTKPMQKSAPKVSETNSETSSKTTAAAAPPKKKANGSKKQTHKKH